MYMPVFSALFFFFTVANMGTPTTANWVGEFLSPLFFYKKKDRSIPT